MASPGRARGRDEGGARGGDDYGDHPSFDDDAEPVWDGDEEEDEPTRPCPYCQAEMLEFAIQCPSCGQYPSEEDFRERTQPRWVVLAAVLCLSLMLLWLLMV